MRGEPTYVLVHSPLVGPGTWRPVAERLAATGRTAVVPDLVAALDALPPLFDALAAAAVDAVGDAPDGVVLVVHSGAGALVPSIVERARWPVHAVVLVDATLPHPGRAWTDTSPAALRDELLSSVGPDGRLPPRHEWFPAEVVAELLPSPVMRAAVTAEIPRVPVAYLTEIAPVLDAWERRPTGYLRLSPAYDDVATEAGRRGWPVVGFEGHHLSAVTQPSAVAAAVLDVRDRAIRAG